MNVHRCALVAIALVASILIARAQESNVSEDAFSAERDAVVRKSLTNFPLITFSPPTNGTDTAIQRFSVNDHLIEGTPGWYLSGVRFTVPAWLDGDLEWVFWHLYQPKDLPRRFGYLWQITPERGPSIRGITNTVRKPFKELPLMKARYPNTEKAYVGTVSRDELKAGQTYVFSWIHSQAVVPDIAIGLTIGSERGHKEFGRINFGPQLDPNIKRDSVARRDSFLQQNFTNFPAVKFLPPTNETDTVFQRFKVNDHMVGEFETNYWSGVRFTAPTWLDGDLEWAFFYLYRSQDLPRRFGFNWFILPEHGSMRSITKYNRKVFEEFPEMQERFPNTDKAYTGKVSLEDLKPGQNYIFWWSHTRAVVPDIAFAFTVDSERGRKEFGSMAWR